MTSAALLETPTQWNALAHNADRTGASPRTAAAILSIDSFAFRSAVNSPFRFLKRICECLTYSTTLVRQQRATSRACVRADIDDTTEPLIFEWRYARCSSDPAKVFGKAQSKGDRSVRPKHATTAGLAFAVSPARHSSLRLADNTRFWLPTYTEAVDLLLTNARALRHSLATPAPSCSHLYRSAASLLSECRPRECPVHIPRCALRECPIW
jgi:hypothetical protein